MAILYAASFSFAAPFRASMALTLLANALSEHEAEQPSLEILTLANHIDINVRGAVVLLVSAYLSAQGFARKKLNLT